MLPLHQDQIESLISVDKPDWFSSFDFAVLVYLMAMCDGHGVCAVTMKTLSSCTGGGSVNFRGQREALRRLEEHGCISIEKSVDKTGMGHRRAYTVDFDKVASEIRVKKGVTSEAK